MCRGSIDAINLKSSSIKDGILRHSFVCSIAYWQGRNTWLYLHSDTDSYDDDDYDDDDDVSLSDGGISVRPSVCSVSGAQIFKGVLL
jgi:hypothetical protein